MSTINEDLFKYPYNRKYPPKPELYGADRHGYKTDNEETIFYDFAVLGYDLRFRYEGKWYYCLSEPDYVAFCDDCFTEEYERFKDGNDFIERFEIDGKKLITIINELEDVEQM